MKKYLLLLLCSVLCFGCTPDYSKDIIGWWVSEDGTPRKYVCYIIRQDGTYKKRMKSYIGNTLLDGADRGKWELDGSNITFHVETYNYKEQHGRDESYKIVYFDNKKMTFETGDGTQFSYLKDD